MGDVQDRGTRPVSPPLAGRAGKAGPVGPHFGGRVYPEGAVRFGQEVGTVVEPAVQEWQACIDACTRCARACEECITSCLKEPDVQARVRCVQLLRDCADVCTLSAALMARGSRYAGQLAGVCATACDDCAAECERFQDEHCQDCARHCRHCAEECRLMSERSRP